MRHTAESRTGPPGLGTPLSTPGHPRLPAPRVFVVDDNASLRASLRALFTDAGVEVIGEAGDSGEALRLIPPIAHSHPLVVLMDVRMPGPVNGIEATRLLIDHCKRVSVIVFTAFPGEGIERAARGAGAVELLAKGCPADLIVEAIMRSWSRMIPVAR